MNAKTSAPTAQLLRSDAGLAYSLWDGSSEIGRVRYRLEVPTTLVVEEFSLAEGARAEGGRERLLEWLQGEARRLALPELRFEQGLSPWAEGAEPPGSLTVDGPLRHRRVSVDGVDTHYVEGGVGEPLLFVHGYTANYLLWSHNLLHFAQRYRVLAPDLVGHGLSAKPSRPYSVSDLGSHLAAFLSDLGLHRVKVVGNSLGGLLAGWLALEHPEMVKAVVFVNSAGLGQKGLPLSTRLLYAPGVLRRLVQLPTPAEVREVAIRGTVHDPALADEVREYMLAGTRYDSRREAFRVAWRAGLATGSREARLYARLGDLTQPALLLWGAQDRQFSPNDAHEAVRRIPRARVEVFEGCGHVAMLEKPDQFNRALSEFLGEEPPHAL